MAKAKEKVLVHYFKVAVAQDPKASDANEAETNLAGVTDVVDVTFLRSAMKVKDDEE